MRPIKLGTGAYGMQVALGRQALVHLQLAFAAQCCCYATAARGPCQPPSCCRHSLASQPRACSLQPCWAYKQVHQAAAAGERARVCSLPLLPENTESRPLSTPVPPDLVVLASVSKDSSLTAGNPPPGSFKEACAPWPVLG